MRISVLIAVLITALLAVSSCVKEHPNQPLANAPPRTYFWLFPDSTIAEGISKQQLRWWGEDSDGFVIGYLFSFVPDLPAVPTPDTLTYTFVTVTDTTVQFPLRQAQQVYLVATRAVDNTFRGLPVNAVVRLTPRPYWDKNADGILDGGDVELPDLLPAMDPSGARRRFPIRNSPPSVTFQKDPANPAQVIPQPDTTFTVASFSWQGTDPDGDETVSSFRIALNDTSSSRWLTIPANINLITLMVPRAVSDSASGDVTADVWSGTFPSMRLQGSLQGLRLNDRNVFYLQARDVAGDFSPLTQLPQGSKTWFVKKPKSRLLVINDYTKTDSLDVRRFYRSVFATVAAGSLANYDELDIRTGSTASTPGILVPSILNPAFVHTLKLFDCVFWYTDQFPSLSVAQFPLYLYVSTGGRVIYSTEFQTVAGDPRGSLVDFAPLDSISTVLATTRIPKNYLMYPDSSVMTDLFPTLEFDSLSVATPPVAVNFHLISVRSIYRRADARYIYHLQPADARLAPQFRYPGMPTLGVIDNAKRFVFLAAPLHLLNGRLSGGQGVAAFLSKVFVQEFGF